MKLLVSLFLLSSCSAHLVRPKPFNGETTYSYVDETGTFNYLRQTKKIDKKIITRNQIRDQKGNGLRLLEKSILVSRIGSIKNKKKRLLTLRPEASEYTVWIDGKKYVSRMQINAPAKSMRISLESPEKKWQGTTEVSFPKAKYFCFFGQLPECLFENSLLEAASSQNTQRFDFYIVWDSYPYIQDLLTGTGKDLFVPAALKFDGEISGLFRYIVEVEGQVILYQFTKNFELVKVAWISQGITIAPPGQEIAEDE